jgi:membrane-associated phospholipid phosphatase
MTRIAAFFLILICCLQPVSGQDNPGNKNKSGTIPFSNLFYQFGTNALHSFTYNYGVNYLLAGLGTYYMVHSGLDWEWSNLAYNNKIMAFAGTPFGAIGFIVPAAIPLGMYIYGRSRQKAEYQITGLALGQAAILGVLVSSSIKTFTGRRDPGIFEGIIAGERGAEDYSGDFAFGFMERGIFSGWPSSHTMVAFAMAVTLAELYPKNLPLKIAAYSYASLIGLGMSVFAHWASDSIAGALIGYSIGKSVGGSYKKMIDDNSNLNGSSGTNISNDRVNLPGLRITKYLSLYVTPVDIGVTIRC